MMIREKGMAFTYRFERYGLDLPSLILHTLVSPIKSQKRMFFHLLIFQQRHGDSFSEAKLALQGVDICNFLSMISAE